MRPFHVIIKPSGAACNLHCRYCFFLEKASLYIGSHPPMPEDMLEACVRDVLAAHPGPDVSITWQGGEPTLMGLSFFERVVSFTERFRRPGQRVLHGLQTNGVLIDDDWARFLAAHHFLVGLSVDGPAPLHDAFRVDRSGRGTHAHVVRAWHTLAAHGVDVNVPALGCRS